MDHALEYFKAIKEGQLEKIKQMLENNPKLLNSKDESGMSGVIVASYYSHPKIVAYLVSKGATLDVFEASMVGDLSSMMNLLEHDKDLANAYSSDGFTPLHLAAFFGHMDAARFLVERRANINAIAKNSMKVTPLHSAVAHNQIEISELLISNGADVNAKQEHNFTPLHGAAQNGNVPLTNLLLRHGAKADVRTSDGKTPLDLTKEGGLEAGKKDDRELVAKILEKLVTGHSLS